MGLQKQMIVTLDAQDIIDHPVSKGDATENNWLKWMKEYLPKRYSADKAFVIDNEGNISEQIDIVIYDKQYSPIVFSQNGTLYITAESVYAVFEIKQDLNKDNMDYARKKIKSVRTLKRTSIPITYSTGKKPAKTLHNIIGGLLTTKTKWKKDIDDLIKKYISNQDHDDQIDFICCLKNSSFYIDYSKEDIKLNKSDNDEVLIFFFIELLLKLQEIGTVPAIDLLQYAKAIDSI